MYYNSYRSRYIDTNHDFIIVPLSSLTYIQWFAHHHPIMIPWFSHIYIYYIYIQWFFPSLSHDYPMFIPYLTHLQLPFLFCPRCSPTAPRQSSGPGCREGRRRDQSRGDRARYGQRWQRAAARGGMQNSLGKSWANWLLYIYYIYIHRWSYIWNNHGIIM